MISYDSVILHALREDIHTGDLTTSAVIPAGRRITARLLAKEPLVVAGIHVAGRVFSLLDPESVFTPLMADGDRAGAGDLLARVTGDARALLQGERVALNLFQRLCGIATLTSRFALAVEGTKARITDTRKTTPGLRVLEKYAVRVGGGSNHRFGLYDGVLIKENHITAAGGITAAVQRARAAVPHTIRIEVETENLEEVREAVAVSADIIMLDNMSLEEMRAAIDLIGGRALVEASGGVNLDTVRGIAETGVDIISVGALTHSARAMDISMLLEGL